MPLTLPPTKPRNPLVAAAQFRQAGAQGRSTKAQRQVNRQALRRELQRHEGHGE
jgi:hypothetical protein